MGKSHFHFQIFRMTRRFVYEIHHTFLWKPEESLVLKSWLSREQLSDKNTANLSCGVAQQSPIQTVPVQGCASRTYPKLWEKYTDVYLCSTCCDLFCGECSVWLPHFIHWNKFSNTFCVQGLWRWLWYGNGYHPKLWIWRLWRRRLWVNIFCLFPSLLNDTEHFCRYFMETSRIFGLQIMIVKRTVDIPFLKLLFCRAVWQHGCGWCLLAKLDCFCAFPTSFSSVRNALLWHNFVHKNKFSHTVFILGLWRWLWHGNGHHPKLWIWRLWRRL